ncbi:MAG: Gfo/Idh/MocA family oxidoreductase [Bifidobacterium sp.]|uniref:Gfo/Idh/MocA family oxidoreductase n=1 Tax=Bifidobacterium fermentum TaxID=3059035 RepID=A0AB39UFT8_9BIFI
MSIMNGNRKLFEDEGRPVSIAILGAGNIANAMARTIQAMGTDERYANLVSLHAVASRDRNRAASFAERFHVPVHYGSYEELVEDDEVDLVYIATPHNFHAEQAILCMKHGKNVLVEKSFTANREQADAALGVSESTGMLCTEAIWTRYMPSRTIIDDLLLSNAIGDVTAVTANLGYPLTGVKRLVDPDLAGGALLDVGIYPLNFIDMVLGPQQISSLESSASFFETGVDAQSSTTLHYANGHMGVASCSMLGMSDAQGIIWGSKGYMICSNINDIDGIDIYEDGHRHVRHIDMPRQLTGYEYEVASAANAILDGESQCPEMTHEDTLRMVSLEDSIRDIWGMTYPFEE